MSFIISQYIKGLSPSSNLNKMLIYLNGSFSKSRDIYEIIEELQIRKGLILDMVRTYPYFVKATENIDVIKLVGKLSLDDIPWIKLDDNTRTDKDIIWTYLYNNQSVKTSYESFLNSTYTACKRSFFINQKREFNHWVKYLN